MNRQTANAPQVIPNDMHAVPCKVSLKLLNITYYTPATRHSSYTANGTIPPNRKNNKVIRAISISDTQNFYDGIDTTLPGLFLLKFGKNAQFLNHHKINKYILVLR